MGYLCNLLIVGLAVGFVGGLALLDFFFFFGCLKVEQINFYFILFEGVPNFVIEGVPKYRASIKIFNYYI